MLRTTPLVIKSAEDQVYEVLRDEILHDLEPGMALPLAGIAERLGVSTMPVRAALMRLEADGLVRQQPRRGAIVAPLEVDDVQEIQAVRAGIDADLLIRDMSSPDIAAQIQRNDDLAALLGIRGTPGFIIGRFLVPGAISYAEMRQLVQESREGG